MTVVGRIEVPEIIAVQQINGAFLARSDHQMPMSHVAGLVGQHHCRSGTQIRVGVGQVLLIVGGKEIYQVQICPIGGQPDETVTIIVVSVKDTVAADEENIGREIGGWSASALPDAAQAAIGSGVENPLPFQSLGLVADDPTVIRGGVSVRPVSQIDYRVEQQQTGTIHVAQPIKTDVSGSVIALTRPTDGRFNYDGSAEFLRPRTQVQRVQPMNIIGVEANNFFGLGLDINGGRNGINHGRAGDSDLRRDVS